MAFQAYWISKLFRGSMPNYWWQLELDNPNIKHFWIMKKVLSKSAYWSSTHSANNWSCWSVKIAWNISIPQGFLVFGMSKKHFTRHSQKEQLPSCWLPRVPPGDILPAAQGCLGTQGWRGCAELNESKERGKTRLKVLVHRFAKHAHQPMRIYSATCHTWPSQEHVLVFFNDERNKIAHQVQWIQCGKRSWRCRQTSNSEASWDQQHQQRTDLEKKRMIWF